MALKAMKPAPNPQ